MATSGFIAEALRATIQALDAGSLFILIGFLAAGLLHEFVSTERIVRLLGGRDWRAIVGAALLGAPLPLCSCAVLPTATLLRRKGASREATMAFLISTPETGVESMALTYGLMGPFMAIARPIAGMATALAAGFASLLAFRREAQQRTGEVDPPTGPAELLETSHHEHEALGEAVHPVPPLRIRLRRAVRYGFITMVDDLAFWLVIAFVLTGILQAALPVDFFSTYLPPGLPSMLLMALIGIPIYVCASESTPLAMALMAKGLDPGSVLVFMLTGPATNAASIAVVVRLFGRRFAAIYISCVVGVAVLAGLLVNAIVDAGWATVQLPGPTPGGTGYGLVKMFASGALACLLGWRLKEKGIRAELAEFRRHCLGILVLLRQMATSPSFRRWAPQAAGVVAALAILQNTVTIVRPGEQCAMRFLGRALPPLGPGLHMTPPWPLAAKTILAVDAVRALPIGFLARREGEDASRAGASRGAPSREAPPASYPAATATFDAERSARVAEGSQFITGDENVISVAAVVHYRVADASLFLFGADAPESLLRALARAGLVEALGRLPIDDVYASGRASTEALVLRGLHGSESLKSAGVRIVGLRLLYVHAPDAVHAAFRDVASAVEDRTTSQNKALVDQEAIVRIASSEAFQAVAGAEADANDRVERSRGDTAFFSQIARRILEAPEVTRTRLRIESFERVLTGKRKIIKPTARQAPGLEIWLSPSGDLEPLPPPPPAPDARDR